MHGTDNDAAHKNPDNGRQPSPDNSNGRTDDGSGTGDRGIVMSENDLFLCWNKINSVFKFFGRD